ncbi:MAG TPA: hypothetical protein VJ739_01605 [Gemmataceae bacterium]|nr:hypothetical protein [Gemmataceae bacterium]
MAEDVTNHPLPDTRPIYRLIRKTRLLLRSTWVLTGLGLTLGLLLGSLAAVTLFDALVPVRPEVSLTPARTILPHVVIPGSALRLLGLLVIVIPTAWVFLLGVVRPLLRRLAAQQVARRIESHIPGIHNRLVSALDLAKSERARQASPAFHRRLLTEALERIRTFRARTVIDFLSLRRAALFTGMTAAGFVLAWVLFSGRMAVAMARIFDPFADIPPESGVHYAVEPGDAKVLRGEDVPFTVRVDRGEPDRLWLELRSPTADERLRYDLERQKADPKVWKFTLGSTNIAPGFEDAFLYRVHGGGTWSKQYRIAMIDRPRVTGYHTVLHYPDYMLIEPRVGPPQTLEVTGPEDSQVEVVVQSEGQVSAGDIQLLDYRQPGPGVKDRPERAWFEDQVPPGAAADGTWNWDSQKVQRPAHTEPPAVGLHGHWFQGAADPFFVGPTDSLFVYAYLSPEHPPEAVVVEWNDGSGWEHRAVWGSDNVFLGKPGTPGHHHAGPLPKPGAWARLEVPAEAVGLAGKALRGMSFKVQGGQVYWSRAGALPPVLGVKESFPLRAAGDNEWSGRFPLHGTGLYRVELRNELGYANKTVKEAKYVAIPDNAPQIVLERPGTDLVLSEPGKVPLVLTAYDDFGLLDVTLHTQRDMDWQGDSRTVKRYNGPARNDSVATTLDLTAMHLKVGDALHYYAEARDRKGQTARTQEYTIRILQAPDAADKQLENFDKTEDPFREKLAKLIAEQAKVRDALKKMDEKYAPTVAKARKAEEEAAKAENQPKGKNPKEKAKPQTAKPPQLDPETAKLLQQMQKELGQLTNQEQQNLQLGQQAGNDLKQLADQMNNLKMLAPELGQQMHELQQLFQKNALDRMQDLANQMRQGSDPKQKAADVKAMKESSERVQKELEALKNRLQALDEARKQMRNDANAALEQLRQEMLRENGKLSARELEELRQHIAELRDLLKGMEGKQEKLHDDTKAAQPKELPAVEHKQEDLDKQLEKMLAAAKELLKQEKARRMKHRPEFPDEPYAPDAGERKLPPREEDPDEPEAKTDQNGKKKTAKKADEKKADDDDKEPLYMPALGGPRPKVDPRYAKKQRPITKRLKGDKQDPEERREDLESRQEQNLQEADAAEKALGSDQSELEKLLNALQNATHPHEGQPHQGQGQQADDEMARQLAQLLQSPEMQQAMAMLARMRQAGHQGHRGMHTAQPNPTDSAQGNPNGSPVSGALTQAELEQLDPNARAAVLKLPPRLREELLQGMREEGPEGYRKFIEDYFKRLTEVKGAK